MRRTSFVWDCTKMILCGIVMGFTSRQMLVQGMTNDQILSSWYGLVVILGITCSVGGTLMAIQDRLLGLVPIGLCLLACHIMWVIPFPQ